MRILPGTTIKLYADVEIDNGEQIAFSSKDKQTAYFTSKLKYTANNCTMNKKTGYVKLNVSGDIASQCNYMSFINPGFDDKEVFCRIIDYDYSNNECTEVDYFIDFFQTWMFDVQYEIMHISRENLSQADWVKLEANPYDQSVLEMRTSETLTVGNSVETINYLIANGETANENDGGSLFYEESTLGVDKWYDILFVSEIDWNSIDDEGDIYTGDIWDDYLKYTMTTDSPISFADWRELNGKGGKLPSVAYGEAVREGYKGDFWAIFYSSLNNWWIKQDDSYSVKTPNTKMSMPYNIYIFNHSATIKLIDVLTQSGCVSSIMGMYTLPERVLNNFLEGQGGNPWTTIEIETSKLREKSSVVSHKLLNFPYSYFTLDDADGNSKEYHYEETYDSNDFKVKIYTTIDLNTQPALIAVTEKGHKTGVGGYGYMLDNAMVYDAIPQTPYMTDAYLTFVAESAKSIIGQNTTDYSYQLEQQQLNNNMSLIRTIADVGGKIVDNITGGITANAGGSGNVTTLGGLVNAGIDTYGTGKSYEISQNRLQNVRNMMSSAVSSLGGDTHSAVAQNFAKCRPAYAANIYHAGSRGGILHYIQGNVEGMNRPDIYYIHHRLNDEIRHQYDLYFQLYGYTSNRCGIPRVCNFINGVTGDSETPHWETVNGKKVTYVQVTDCKVIHAMLPVSQYIQALFQNGCRFLNGDSLIGGNE